MLQSLKDVLDSQQLSFRYIKPQDETTVDLSAVLLEQLKQIDGKLERIKEAYRNGVDTLEEYKENKLMVEKEQQLLEKQLAELPEEKSDQDLAESHMLERVRNVYEIVSSESVDDVTKNEILKSIIEKIVYNKEEDTLEVYYYYKPQTQ